MQRYFVDQENWYENAIQIIGDDYHHIVNVMRMTKGTKIICNHPSGVGYLAEIETITDQEVRLQIIKKLSHQVEIPVNVTLIQGLAKGDKLDWIVQKATELGVNRVIPLNSQRSIVKWDEKRQKKKIERLEKIAKEAAEQSHRTIQPTIDNTHSLKKLVENEKDFDHKFVAYEETTREISVKDLNHYLERIEPGESVAIVIGPEGGLTKEEVELLYDKGYEPIRLGPRILRTETAPIYFLSALSYILEETK